MCAAHILVRTMPGRVLYGILILAERAAPARAAAGHFAGMAARSIRIAVLR